MIAGRHGEAVPFGFEAANSQSDRYLSLAFPGKTPSGEFLPAYIKMRAGKGFEYIELWAWTLGDKVVVQSRKVNEDEAPKVLLSALPYNC